MADDAGADPAFSIYAACTYRRGAIREFYFSDRAELRRTVSPVHGSAFHKHACLNVVPAANVVEEVEEEIPAFRAIPEMMVRIDDGQIRLNNGLIVAGEPLWAHCKVRIRRVQANAHLACDVE